MVNKFHSAGKAEKAATEINKLGIKGVTAKTVDIPKGDGLSDKQRKALKKLREDLKGMK